MSMIYAQIILPVVMGVLLLGWIIFCTAQLIRQSKKAIAAMNITCQVKCETCGTAYEVSAAEFTRSFMSKSFHTTKTEFKNGVFINRRRYHSFAKKFHCPVCGKKRYAQVLNINEISNLTQKSSMTIGIRWLIIMIIGGLLLMGFFSIPMHFVNKAAANHAEKLRQEQFEELREQYF